MEAVFLSQFGGAIGVLLGIGGGNIVSIIFKIPAVIPIRLGNNWNGCLLFNWDRFWYLSSLASFQFGSNRIFKI